MQSRSTQQSYFIYALAGLCCFYLGFEIFFNYYAMLLVDEFWFAHKVYAFKDQLPYRDFAPYKTVLGYYLLLFPLLAKQGVAAPLIFVKNALAVLNTVILLVSSWWFTRYFSRAAILAALALMITSEIVLTYSTNFRVDLLGYWFGFFALLSLIENRYAAAGVLMGLGFATTQKVIWYIAASNGALGLYWLLYQRNLPGLRNAFTFNLMLLGAIMAYLCFWSLLSDWNTVIRSVFYEAAALYHLDWYDSARMFFWKAITLNNPLVLLWPLAFLSICVSHAEDHAYRQRFLIVVFSLIIFACLVPYKMIFPYYMQVAIPALFMLYAAFFSWLIGIFAARQGPIVLLNKNLIALLLAVYIAAYIWFTVRFALPLPYLFMCMVPLLLGAYIINFQGISPSSRTLVFTMVCVAIVIVNGIFPLMLFCIRMVDINGSYQKQNLAIMQSLMQDDSDYLAGIELIYNKNQPIPGMRSLIGPALDYLNKPTPKLRAVMLASLDEDPDATADSAIAAIKQSKVKFYVNNYRMLEVPEKIKRALDDEYEHFWGSVYLYAPQVHAAQKKVYIRFAGNYRVQSSQSINIDGRNYAANKTVYLVQGMHQSNNRYAYRLKLLPDNLAYMQNLNHQADRWEKMLF